VFRQRIPFIAATTIHVEVDEKLLFEGAYDISMKNEWTHTQWRD